MQCSHTNGPTEDVSNDASFSLNPEQLKQDGPRDEENLAAEVYSLAPVGVAIEEFPHIFKESDGRKGSVPTKFAEPLTTATKLDILHTGNRGRHVFPHTTREQEMIRNDEEIKTLFKPNNVPDKLKNRRTGTASYPKSNAFM